MVEINNLKDLYKEGSSMAKGYEFNYKGWTFRKCGSESDILSGAEHSEFMLFNPKGNHIETLSIMAFDSEKEFINRIDEILEYNPEDMKDWLNRNKGD